MPEMLAPTGALIGAGPGRKRRPDHGRPLLRWHLGHGGGPRRRRKRLAKAETSRSCRRGTRITIDAHQLVLSLNIADDAELAKPSGGLDVQPEPRYTRGVQAKFAFKAASSASKGAVLDLYSSERPALQRFLVAPGLNWPRRLAAACRGAPPAWRAVRPWSTALALGVAADQSAQDHHSDRQRERERARHDPGPGSDRTPCTGASLHGGEQQAEAEEQHLEFST